MFKYYFQGKIHTKITQIAHNFFYFTANILTVKGCLACTWNDDDQLWRQTVIKIDLNRDNAKSKL